MPPFDVDDWAKEDCACGHRRHAHYRGTGACTFTRQVRVAPPSLPPAEFAPGEEEDPFAAPVNWPAYESWPHRTIECCTGFYDAGLAAAEAGDP